MPSLINGAGTTEPAIKLTDQELDAAMEEMKAHEEPTNRPADNGYGFVYLYDNTVCDP